MIATERLILRELAESDAPALFAIESRPDVTRYLTRDITTLEDAASYIAESIGASVVVPRRVHDLAVTREGAVIGRCGIGRDDNEPRQCMVWYVLDPAHHGHGYATEAARALVNYAFAELGVHRVYADIDPRNPPSVRVAERLGMRREAHFIENIWIRGEWCDTLIYAVLKREWTNP